MMYEYSRQHPETIYWWLALLNSVTAAPCDRCFRFVEHNRSIFFLTARKRSLNAFRPSWTTSTLNLKNWPYVINYERIHRLWKSWLHSFITAISPWMLRNSWLQWGHWTCFPFGKWRACNHPAQRRQHRAWPDWIPYMFQFARSWRLGSLHGRSNTHDSVASVAKHQRVLFRALSPLPARQREISKSLIRLRFKRTALAVKQDIAFRRAFWATRRSHPLWKFQMNLLSLNPLNMQPHIVRRMLDS